MVFYKAETILYKEHDLFVPPTSDAVLWRYVDFTKFVSLLDKQALFFSRADKLGDPFEGSFSKVNVALRPEIYKDQIPEAELQKLVEFTRQLPKFTLISCWHGNGYESAAMWRLYARDRDGIAIRTDFVSLSASLVGDEDVFIGKVNYVDYDQTFIPEGNTMAPFLYKRKSFEHEREVRAMMQTIPFMDARANVFEDNLEAGTYFDVDLSRLVHEVVVSPFAGEWFLDLVRSVASRYHLEAQVNRSPLAEAPIWG